MSTWASAARIAARCEVSAAGSRSTSESASAGGSVSSVVELDGLAVRDVGEPLEVEDGEVGGVLGLDLLRPEVLEFDLGAEHLELARAAGAEAELLLVEERLRLLDGGLGDRDELARDERLDVGLLHLKPDVGRPPRTAL